MVKDGEDKHGLQTTNLKKMRLNFSRCTNRDVVLFNICTKQNVRTRCNIKKTRGGLLLRVPYIRLIAVTFSHLLIQSPVFLLVFRMGRSRPG